MIGQVHPGAGGGQQTLPTAAADGGLDQRGEVGAVGEHAHDG
ncbi:MAG: hypothetical protein ACRDRO_22190 [Pseudonocardiaceae bacterium]